MASLIAAVVALVIPLLFPWGARAEGVEHRVALVIGNDSYPVLHASLANAGADARGMGAALSAAGFETTVKINVKRRELYELIDAFAAKISASPDTVGLFYYAGHGVQANGKNYLIPVDGAIETEADLEAEAVDTGKLLNAMDEARNNVNIVILDACRDNPLPKGRSLSRGLAPMQAPRGTFIGYAAAPGQSALDGNEGGNGVFTGALLQQLEVPGITIEEVFKRVIAGVQERSAGRQTPWMESSLQGNFYFFGPATAKAQQPNPTAIAPTAIANDVLFWESIKSSSDPADFEDFVKQFPQSAFAGLAARRIAALRAPPSPPTRSTPPAPSASAPPAPSTPPVPSASASPSTEVSPADNRNIARELESELARVGCYRGTIDGIWGRNASTALQQFNAQAGTNLDIRNVNSETVETVRGKSDRVCPLTCPPTQRLDSNKCVPIVCDTGLVLTTTGRCVRTPQAKPNWNSPVDSAPTYSAPTYSAPTYSAPTYSAPTYSTGGAYR